MAQKGARRRQPTATLLYPGISGFMVQTRSGCWRQNGKNRRSHIPRICFQEESREVMDILRQLDLVRTASMARAE